MLQTHPFDPIYDENSRVLILGSFPSPASRANYYYGHPQNRFWKTLSELFSVPLPAPDRESKRSFILSHRLALWDVLHSCEITGADDSTIKNPVPNKFQPLFAKSKISAIFTNGKKATELFQKLCAKEAGQNSIYLPSTSPANRAMQGKPEFMDLWREITFYIPQTKCP
uniref:G:T/U mismatch-specific uracil/thymine DNA-glycosylase n=1 Tax=uncultured bacterium contig00029 TaxID=1181518 RepID=A0A806JYL9_9BACT|nr:G:T/U mismatch-specific uracil/thymine DNA-glycosylase [uncultured bacterium contig00029]